MKKIIKLFFIISLFIWITLSTFAETNNKTQIQKIDKNSSSFENDLFSGIWSYKYDFSFLEWQRWLTPSLSLNYNTARVDYLNDSWYGFNFWVESIFRSTKKWQDKLYNLDEYAINSSFSYNELIKTWTWVFAWVNNNDLSKYNFENDTWIVKDTKWNTYYFWENIDSKQVNTDNNKTFRWVLSKKIDIFWNEIRYSYIKANNNIYLSEINYGFINGQNPLYKVKIDYLDKSFSTSSYIYSFKLENYKLLSSLTLQTLVNWVYVDGKKYELTYIDQNTIFPKLTQIKEFFWTEVNNITSFEYYNSWIWINLLSKINNWKWLITTLEYKAASLYGNTTVPFLLKTLNKVTYEDITTELKYSITYDYYWWNFYFDPTNIYNRGYTWFNKVKILEDDWSYKYVYFHQSDTDKNNLTDTQNGEFEDHISKKWRIYREEGYDKDWKIYNTKITKWIKQDKWNNIYFIIPERVTNILWNKLWNHIDSGENFEYDNFWNVIKNIKYWEVSANIWSGDFSDIKEDKKISKFSYSNNENKNLFWFINSQEVYDFDNNLSYKKEILYDNLWIWEVNFWNPTSVKTYENQNEFVQEINEYDSKWLLVKQTNPKGYSTNYSYDQYWIYPISVTNAKWFVESYEYDYESGKPKKIVNINGLEKLYTYDKFWRLLSEKIKNSEWTYKVKDIFYDNLNIPNNIKQVLYYDKNQNDSQETKIYLNWFWNEIQTKKSYKDKFITTKFEYDNKWNKIYITYPTFENNSNYSVLNKQTEFGDKYEYDSQNRIIKISNKSWDITYDYNNLDFTITNQKWVNSNYKYDIFWNLIKVTEPWNLETKYSYNILWQLVKIVDSQNNERNIVYDLSWKRLEIEDLHKSNDTNFWKRKYEYDDNWNVIKYITMSNQNIIYNYDNLDRLVSETFWSNITNYNYDIWNNAKWLLTSYTKWDYSEGYYYDNFWNLSSETKDYWDDEYTYNYEYNLLWQKTSQIFPDNKQTNYIYENGILNWVNYDWTNLVKNVEYNPLLKITDLKYWNDAITKNIYDYEYWYRMTQKWLIFWENQYWLTKYTFDNLGNITNLKEEWNIPSFQKNINYTYDDLNRLLEAKYSDTEKYNYTFDSLWNIISNSELWNYNYIDNWRNNPHGVTNIWDINYDYDNNWNLNTYTNSWVITKSFNYNAKDELVSFSDNIWNTTNYKYNTSWIRVEKVASGSVDRYVNKDYEVEIIWDWTWTTIKTSKYIYFWNVKLATIENKDWTESIIYHHEDHLWGWNIDLSSTWWLLQVVDYLPFWQIKTKQNNSSYENKYLFTWKEQDQESDLQYFEARYYDNEIWRFESIDRVFWEVWGKDKKNKYERWDKVLYEPQKLNAYSYVTNNPLIYVDPSWEDGEALDNPYTAALSAWCAIWQVLAEGVIITIDKVYWEPKMNELLSSWWTGGDNWKKPKKDDENKKIDTNYWELEITKHAFQRMIERWVSLKKVKDVINKWETFNYIKDWKTLQWFYDKASQIFVWRWNNWITTVINKVTEKYISNLKATYP